MSFKGLFLYFVYLIFSQYCLLAESDSISKKSSLLLKENSAQDIRTGERIFYGLEPTSGSKTPTNCASCHNIGHIDNFNWNPSAMDLANKFGKCDFDSFKKVLTQPSGKLMTQIHGDIDFSDVQLRQIKSFLTNLAIQGEGPQKPLLTKRILFISFIILFLLAFIDLIITKKIKFRFVHIAVLLTTTLLITSFIVTSAIELGRSQNYQPDQPIKFSHKVHVGQNGTQCIYCHFNAEQSKSAGIPPASVCMNCHIIVREGSRSGKCEINKIFKAIDNNKPIEWVKVHNLPDYVFFSHAQHVMVGKIVCEKCHGNVAQMDQIKQVHDLSMGWCVNCHRETKVQFDNKFYGKYEQLHKDLKDGKINMVTAAKIGGTDCMKCHY
jgi:cytochrome c553